MFHRRYLRTTIITLLSLCVMAGLVVSKFAQMPTGKYFLLLLPAVLLVRRRNVITILIASVIFFLFGLWRGSLQMQQLAKYKALYGNKVVLQVRSIEDSVYADKGQIEFMADNIRSIGNDSVLTLAGRVRVRGYGEFTVQRYDEVTVEGKLMTSLSGSRQATISFANLTVTSSSSSLLERVRKKFSSAMYTAIPEPHSSFALGLLVGQRSTLSDEVTDELSAVGLTHVVAVSGYNLTIIISFFMRLMKKRSKYQIVVLSLVCIACFMLFTGFSPSIIRAAWVSGLSLLAWYYGRQFKPVVLVCFAAMITAFLNPLYIYGDIGWYLSVLAFFGVLVLGPLINRYFLHNRAGGFSLLVIESVSAQLMTLPLIIAVFGKVALYGLIANILIVPLVPMAMLFSLLASIPFMIPGHLFALLALPAKYLLLYMLNVVHVLAGLPGAVKDFKISYRAMYAIYSVLIMVVLYMHYTARRKEQKLIQLAQE